MLRVVRYTHACGDQPLAGYTIKRGIGIGGFGEVYFAISDAGKEVALKRIQRNADIELRGVGHCLNLKHANLIALWDIRTDSQGVGWVVMEYVPGESLRETIERHPEGMKIDEITDWFRGVLAGVKHLHDRGVVHRDLKPGNIFRDADNDVVKIGDYGLSKLIGGGRSGHTETVGTFHYMAPEVGRGIYGREVDLYALGVILYEMFTGHPPFDGETSHEIIMKHLTGDPDLTRIPPAFRSLLQRLLDKDPERRFRDASSLTVAFERSLLEARESGIVTMPVGESVSRRSVVGRTRATTEVIVISEDTVKVLPEPEIVLGELREIVVAETFEPPAASAAREVTAETSQAKPQEKMSPVVKPALETPSDWDWSLWWRLAVVVALVSGAGAFPEFLPVLVVAACISFAVRWGIWLVDGNFGLSSVRWREQRAAERLPEPRRFRRYYRELPESFAMVCITVAAGIGLALAFRGGWSVEAGVFGAALITAGTVSAGWATVLGRRWDGVREERLLQGLASLIAGLGGAVVSVLMLRWLQVDLADPFGELGTNELLIAGKDVVKSPSFVGPILAFTIVAIIPRWWRWTESRRRQRLSLTPIWGAMVLGSLADLAMGWPFGWGIVLSVVVATAVQLAAPRGQLEGSRDPASSARSAA